MYDEQGRKNKAKDLQSQERTDLGMNSVRRQKFGLLLRQLNDIAVIDVFNEKRKCCNHRCPVPVDFHMLLLIIHLGANETLICRREMSLIGSTSFGFAQNKTHDF